MRVEVTFHGIGLSIQKDAELRSAQRPPGILKSQATAEFNFELLAKCGIVAAIGGVRRWDQLRGYSLDSCHGEGIRRNRRRIARNEGTIKRQIRIWVFHRSSLELPGPPYHMPSTLNDTGLANAGTPQCIMLQYQEISVFILQCPLWI